MSVARTRRMCDGARQRLSGYPSPRWTDRLQARSSPAPPRRRAAASVTHGRDEAVRPVAARAVALCQLDETRAAPPAPGAAPSGPSRPQAIRARPCEHGSRRPRSPSPISTSPARAPAWSGSRAELDRAGDPVNAAWALVVASRAASLQGDAEGAELLPLDRCRDAARHRVPPHVEAVLALAEAELGPAAPRRRRPRGRRRARSTGQARRPPGARGRGRARGREPAHPRRVPAGRARAPRSPTSWPSPLCAPASSSTPATPASAARASGGRSPRAAPCSSTSSRRSPRLPPRRSPPTPSRAHGVRRAHPQRLAPRTPPRLSGPPPASSSARELESIVHERGAVRFDPALPLVVLLPLRPRDEARLHAVLADGRAWPAAALAGVLADRARARSSESSRRSPPAARSPRSGRGVHAATPSRRARRESRHGCYSRGSRRPARPWPRTAMKPNPTPTREAAVVAELSVEGVDKIAGVTWDGHSVWFADGHARGPLRPQSRERRARPPPAPRPRHRGHRVRRHVPLSKSTARRIEDRPCDRRRSWARSPPRAARAAASAGPRGRSGSASTAPGAWSRSTPRPARCSRPSLPTASSPASRGSTASLWHGTWEGDASELRHVNPDTGRVVERIELPADARCSGVEADDQGRLWCGDGATGKLRAVRRGRLRPITREGDHPMCPVCFATTAAIVAAGATSAGGLAALARKVVRGRSGAPPLEDGAKKGAGDVRTATQEPAHDASKVVLRVSP